MSAPLGKRVFRSKLTTEGYAVVACPGCQAWPLRDLPECETLGQYNYLRTCASCHERLCLICLAPDAMSCHACQAAAALGAVA